MESGAEDIGIEELSADPPVIIPRRFGTGSPDLPGY